jgi:hypothetical protein
MTLPDRPPGALAFKTSLRAHPRTYWKATLRSAPPLAFILLGEWHQQVRIFRWKWLASAVARLHKHSWRSSVLRDAVVEPYSPGANVVPLNALPARTGQIAEVGSRKVPEKHQPSSVIGWPASPR